MTPSSPNRQPDRLRLTSTAAVHVPAHCPEPLQHLLIRHFRVRNPAFDEAERFDRRTDDLPEYLFHYSYDADGTLLLPHGAVQIIARLCRNYGVTVEWADETHVAPAVSFDEQIALSAAQEQAVGQVLSRRMGVLQAPAGSGKTCMGLVAVARRQQPALWLTHTKELAYQAIARAGQVLGLAPEEIGLVGDGQRRIGERLTVALVQSLAREIPPALLKVGHVIVDEAHHAPAEMVAGVVAQFPARYLLGLTATPTRRDGLDQVIFWTLGPIVAELDAASLAERLVRPQILKRDTGVCPGGDSFAEILGWLIGHPRRNALIVDDIAAAVAAGRRCLVLSERVEHVEMLAGMLQRRNLAAAPLHGGLGRRVRSQVVADLADGKLAAVVATTSLIAEGFDVPALSGLFLATPMSYGGRVVQAIGRVSRSAPGKNDAIVYDYTDDNRMLWATWKNRRRVYTGQGCTVTWAPATQQKRSA